MWRYERTAGTQPGWAGLPAVLLLFGLIGILSLALPGGVLAQEGKEDLSNLRTKLGIHGVVEIEFFAERGMGYTVEARGGDGTWSPVYGPVFGRGSTIGSALSGFDESTVFRLSVGGMSEFGNAPLALEGHTYALNYGSRLAGLHFATLEEGVAEDQAGTQLGFAYRYEKLEPDLAELALEFSDGSRETLTLGFYRGRIGDFDGIRTREGGRQHRVSGTFRAGDDVAPTGATPPPTLEGSKFIFRDRGMISILAFTTDFSGSLSRAGGETEIISYTYDPSTGAGSEASIVVAFPESNETQHFAVEFDARNSGNFTRRVLRDGELRDTDRGRFSGKGAQDGDDDGKGGGNTETECLAPESLRGRTLQASVDGEVVTILLDRAGSGSVLKRRANGGVALQPFIYTYSKETSSEGLLTITFLSGAGEDETHVFELEFTSRKGGECVRKRYEGGELDDSDDGPFTLSSDDIAGGDNFNGGDDDE